MMKWSLALSAAALAALPGCASHGREARTERRDAAPAGWRAIATPADRDRVRMWRTAWTQALAMLTAPADRRAAVAEGVLLRPDSALPGPMPPAGDYRCRVTKLGAKDAGGQDYVAYPAFRCRIAAEGDALSFAKLTGSQRPTGLLFPDDDGRMVLLGSMMLGDERRSLDYGRDPDRDVVGLMERIGQRRWRLVMPFPRWESTVDVIELTPAA